MSDRLDDVPEMKTMDDTISPIRVIELFMKPTVVPSTCAIKPRFKRLASHAVLSPRRLGHG